MRYKWHSTKSRNRTGVNHGREEESNMCKHQPAVEREAVNPEAATLKKSSSLNETQVLDMSLLHASESGDLEVATNVIRQGANVNSADATGKTALHIATFGGHVKLACALLLAGADSKARDHLDKTPLHHAASRGNVETAKDLVAAECDVQAQDKWGKTALHIIADGKTGNGQSPQGHILMMSILIEAGGKADILDNQGKSALHIAAMRGHAEVVSMLLSGGADPQSPDAEGKTALHHAARCVESGAVRVLLEAAVDAAAVDKLGKTALHGAARAGTLALLDHNVNADAADLHGRTALHDAAGSASTDVCGALIAAGAGVNARDLGGCTPLDLVLRNRDAAQKGDIGGRNVLALLKSHGGLPGKRVGACFRMF